MTANEGRNDAKDSIHALKDIVVGAAEVAEYQFTERCLPSIHTDFKN